LQANWQIPENLNFGHHDYIPGQQICAAYPEPVDIPPEDGPVPPLGTPPQFAGTDLWKPAWSAAFASTRYK
jgi:hypothetical protein